MQILFCLLMLLKAERTRSQLMKSPGFGSAVTGLQGYCATVSVGAPGASWNGIPTADPLLIEVEVTTPGGEAIRLEASRVNF